ncbi:MAG: ABC transporter permease [Synergistaceae bacterium]|nr:ABC transporter permease [Synergistaceae bacterium]
MHFAYVKNELLKRKRRSAFVITGIALSISVLVAVNALADAFMGAAQKPLQDFGTDIIIQRNGDTPDDFGGATLPCSQVIITAQEVESLKKINGIKQMSTALLMWVFDGEDYSDSGSFVIATGIEPGLKLGPSIANDWLIDGTGINPGNAGIALIDSVFAEQKGIKAGDTFKISGYPFEVVGIVRTPPNSLISASNVFIPLEDAQNIALEAKNIPDYKPGDINEIFLQADPDNLNEIINEIKTAIPKASVTSAESFIQAIGGIAAQSRNFAVIGSIAVLLFSLVVVVKTISGNIMERRNEIGIMKTVGWTSNDIYRQLITETFIQSLIGGAAGIGIGFLIALALGRLQISVPVAWDIDPFPHFMMTDTSQKALDVGLPVQISSGLVGIALVASVAIGTLSAFLTLKSINRIKPSEVLRYE